MNRGRFITLEGGEGVGKSTQARLLAEALLQRGLEVLVTREPGGTPGAERIRDLLLDPASPDWGTRAEALLFAAARADHISNAIEPALERGAWVVCDRYLDSTRAYQAGEGGLGDADILALHRHGAGGLMPDLTVLLCASSDTVAERLRARDGENSDRIGGRDTQFHARVADRFAAIAEAEPDRVAVVDAMGAPKEVHARIMATLKSLA